MKQLYLYPLMIIGLLLLSSPAFAQVSAPEPPVKEVPIEGLSIFPNPASGQKVYINTKAGKAKRVEIYNVLGKSILSAQLTGNELNISNLEPGVYIMRIQEGRSSATRKLVVR
ncbi:MULTISPECIES: T9SS type A sorting domain-containing protein [Salinimicrobium]|uniref:T9SS type A sorting domain-containing protein n=1 Tax=Salinimicrobium profundisediminis TaxID=2994553 RepID=A0A9X3I0P4_9FLAO|nr:T9SS type A sorting domain-containing protein [Salinimicrobium profundisediminis]MCX2837142.1 T9SS type A sorting domain-containing protein [Salinimicrobium profundisediminis]